MNEDGFSALAGLDAPEAAFIVPRSKGAFTVHDFSRMSGDAKRQSLQV